MFAIATVLARRTVLMLATLALQGVGAQARPTPSGRWSTIDDADGRATAVVDIREVDGAYVGTVRELLVPATHDDSICTKCRGDRRDKPVVGMEILRGMRPTHANEWGGGEILDPENGKTYKATMTLEDDGRRLVVRGYIGFSLFGRSQVWLRRP